MKHFILPVLCWTLATCPIIAQKTLTPGVQLYADSWPVALKNILQDAGFGLAPAPVATPLALRNSDLQLDSTKTFGYNLNSASDSIPQRRSIYERPQSNVEIETEALFQQSAWMPVTRLSKVLDAQGRLIELLASEYDMATETFQPGSKLLLFPHGNSLEEMDSIKAFIWDAEQGIWGLVFQVNNTFNAQDKLTISQISIHSDGETVLITDHYSYDANQDNHLIESFMQSGGGFTPTGKQELMYFNHLVIQVIDFETNGLGGFTPTTRITYAYNSSPLVIQENTYQWVPGVNDWNPTQTVMFEYDNAERLAAKETVFIQTGAADVKERVTFAYVEDEFLALESTYFWDATQDTYELDNRTYYYYAGDVLSVSPGSRAAQTLIIAPNPTTDAIRFRLETEAEVRVYDVAGQLMQSGIIQPGEALYLSTLPSGVYQVTAHHGAQFYTGKVLKF